MNRNIQKPKVVRHKLQKILTFTLFIVFTGLSLFNSHGAMAEERKWSISGVLPENQSFDQTIIGNHTIKNKEVYREQIYSQKRSTPKQKNKQPTRKLDSKGKPNLCDCSNCSAQHCSGKPRKRLHDKTLQYIMS